MSTVEIETFTTLDEAINSAIETARIEARTFGNVIEINVCAGPPCKGGDPCALCDVIRVWPDGDALRGGGRVQ